MIGLFPKETSHSSMRYIYHAGIFENWKTDSIWTCLSYLVFVIIRLLIKVRFASLARQTVLSVLTFPLFVFVYSFTINGSIGNIFFIAYIVVFAVGGALVPSIEFFVGKLMRGNQIEL